MLLYEVSDVAIACSLVVAQIMAFIHNDQLIISCIINIYRFSHGHYICLQVILPTIFCPHILQVGGADNQRIAAECVFIHLGNSAGGNGFSQSNHIANHGTATFLVVQMAGCDFDRCLLELKEAVPEFRRNRKFLDA